MKGKVRVAQLCPLFEGRLTTGNTGGMLSYKVYKVYKDKAFSQELRLLACS